MPISSKDANIATNGSEADFINAVR